MTASEAQPAWAGGLRLLGAMLSDVGRVRPLNEDAVAFVAPPPDRTTAECDSLLIVADGMGGHAAGEIASAMAVEVVRRVYFRMSAAPPDRLRAAFSAANEAIVDYGRQNPRSRGLGTTCTAFAVRGDRAWLAHIGDSRGYLLRNRALMQLSEDQSLVARMIREGAMTPEAARTSAHKNIILQALGARPDIEPQFLSEGLALAPGDALILCSDGLHTLVPDQRIARIASELAPHAACEALIRCALDAGGYDNVSVGVFRLDQAALARPGRPDTRRVAAIGPTPLHPPHLARLA